MASWDDEEEDTVAPIVQASGKSKFADEDVSDEEVKEEWDASSDEEVVKPAPVAVGSLKNKGATQQKIAMRDAEDARKAAQRLADANDTPAMRKERENAAIIQADLDNANDLLGYSSIKGDSDLFSMPIKNNDDMIRFSNLLSSKLITKQSTNPLYAKLIRHLVISIAEPLRDVDVRGISTDMTALATKKKEEKTAALPKKKQKAPTLGAGKTIGTGRADTSSYSETLDDDYDDFM